MIPLLIKYLLPFISYGNVFLQMADAIRELTKTAREQADTIYRDFLAQQNYETHLSLKTFAPKLRISLVKIYEDDKPFIAAPVIGCVLYALLDLLQDHKKFSKPKNAKDKLLDLVVFSSFGYILAKTIPFTFDIFRIKPKM